jgi:uncharacterized protein YxeA
MKKNKLITVLILFLTIIISNSCKKKVTIDTEVPATQIGANTFGCMINGQIVKVSGKKGFLSTGGLIGVAYPDEFYISIVTQTNRRDITINLRFNHQPGIFAPLYLKDKNIVTLVDNVEYNGTNIGGDNYYTSTDKSVGNIQITKVDSNVLAGRFNLDLYNSLGQIIQLTDGRFDISLQ